MIKLFSWLWTIQSQFKSAPKKWIERQGLDITFKESLMHFVKEESLILNVFQCKESWCILEQLIGLLGFKDLIYTLISEKCISGLQSETYLS